MGPPKDCLLAQRLPEVVEEPRTFPRAHLSRNWAALQPSEKSAAAAVFSGPSGCDREGRGACLRRRLRLLVVY